MPQVRIIFRERRKCCATSINRAKSRESWYKRTRCGGWLLSGSRSGNQWSRRFEASRTSHLLYQSFTKSATPRPPEGSDRQEVKLVLLPLPACSSGFLPSTCRAPPLAVEEGENDDSTIRMTALEPEVERLIQCMNSMDSRRYGCNTLELISKAGSRTGTITPPIYADR